MSYTESVTKALLFVVVFGLGFALGSFATCPTIQAVVFDQGIQFCVVLLIAFLSGAACAWMGIYHGPRSFCVEEPLSPAEWAERNLDYSAAYTGEFDPTSRPYWPWAIRDDG